MNDNIVQFPMVVVPPRGSVNVGRDDLAPTHPFRPLQMMLEGDLTDLYVCELKVGRCSQLLSAQCLPATLFKDPKSPLLNLDLVLPPKMSVILNLYNASDVEKKVVCRLTGTVDVDSEITTLGFLCGLGAQLVPPQSSRTFCAYSQCTFESARLHVPMHLLKDLSITTIKLVRRYVAEDVGDPKLRRLSDEEVITGPEHVLAVVQPSCYTTEALSHHLTELMLVPSRPFVCGDEICLTIKNYSMAAAWFSGCLIGHVLR